MARASASFSSRHAATLQGLLAASIAAVSLVLFALEVCHSDDFEAAWSKPYSAAVSLFLGYVGTAPHRIECAHGAVRTMQPRHPPPYSNGPMPRRVGQTSRGPCRVFCWQFISS